MESRKRGMLQAGLGEIGTLLFAGGSFEVDEAN